MKFIDIIGQEEVKAQLIQMVDNERIPHAQILLGATGTGALPLAIAFAQYVLCENKTAGESCGRCRACIKVSKHIHPDVHYSYPTIGAKMVSTNFLKEWKIAIEENAYLDINQWLQKIDAENKQGNITKDECLNIIKKLSLKTFEGKYKILIMWLPEYLGKEGNRLLKLIEEPPDNTLFLLVAENIELILNTILSRCQLLKINNLTDNQIIENLVNRHQIDEEKATNAARLANGNFNEALSLVSNIENDHAKIFLEWFRACYKGNGEEIMKWVTDFTKKTGREGQKQLITYALHFLREFLLLKMVGEGYKLRLQGVEENTAQNMTKVLNHEQVDKMMELFNELHYNIERNGNGKILFLDSSIQLHKIFRKKY